METSNASPAVGCALHCCYSRSRVAAASIESMGCGASKVAADASARSSAREEAFDILCTLDAELASALLAKHIRIMRTGWLLNQPAGWVWEKRQYLETLEAGGETPFLTPEEALGALESGRGVGVVSHAWSAQVHPDGAGAHLAALRPFLEAHPSILGVFFDFCSVLQLPRTADEDASHAAGLRAMASLYASPLGSTVLQARRRALLLTGASTALARQQ